VAEIRGGVHLDSPPYTAPMRQSRILSVDSRGISINIISIILIRLLPHK